MKVSAPPKKLSKKKIKHLIEHKLYVGRNEWCQLPQLNIPAIKAKIDTGAKTSAIHAFNIHKFYRKGLAFVRFFIHPLQNNDKVAIKCEAMIIDERVITSSNGHKEHRCVIFTPLKLGNQTWNIEITLSDRDPLKFRMLLGREALAARVIIDPSRQLCQGKIKKDTLGLLYNP